MGAADAPLALANHAHQAEGIAGAILDTPGAGGPGLRRPRPRGARAKAGTKGVKGAGRNANAGGAPPPAAADQGAAWGNWQNAWGNGAAVAKAAPRGGKGGRNGKGGRAGKGGRS